MKNHLRRAIGSAIMLALFLSSCASLDKLVETGQYDKALEKAIKRLAGKNNKNHEQVLALERAFEKATARDMDRINKLTLEKDAKSWERVYSLAHRIERRQEAVRPLLPLIDREGYKAEFAFVEVDPIIADAREGAASNYYRQAIDQLDKARAGDRKAARKAYDLLRDIDRFYKHYKDKESLKEQAYNLGQTYIAFSVLNETDEIMPAWLSEELVKLEEDWMSTRWRTVLRAEAGEGADYMAELKIRSVYVSPESWKEVIEHTSEEIEEREFLRDDRGNFVRDSSGNKIEFVHKYTVRATVTEIIQHKSAEIVSYLEVRDSRDGRLVLSEDFTGAFSFHNRAASFKGDKRALGSYEKYLGQPVPFPSDAELLLEAGRRLKPRVVEYILEDRRLI